MRAKTISVNYSYMTVRSDPEKSPRVTRDFASRRGKEDATKG